jgi:hypothetical protein
LTSSSTEPFSSSSVMELLPSVDEDRDGPGEEVIFVVSSNSLKKIRNQIIIQRASMI